MNEKQIENIEFKITYILGRIEYFYDLAQAPGLSPEEHSRRHRSMNKYVHELEGIDYMLVVLGYRRTWDEETDMARLEVMDDEAC